MKRKNYLPNYYVHAHTARWMKGLVLIGSWMCFWLAGCSPEVQPSSTASPVSKTSVAATEAEPTGFFPSSSTPTVNTSPAHLLDTQDLLERAVANLLDADSFEMVVKDIRAYQSTRSDGTVHLTYGEFNTWHTVIFSPTLKVHSHYEYRYDTQSDFFMNDSYSFERDGRYFTQLVEDSASGELQEMDYTQTQPMAGDLFQTLVKYARQAEFLSEQDGIAVYTLLHPHWYELAGAAGFADLGLLFGQENEDASLEQYVQTHFPGVQTVRFTLYVSVTEQHIVKVVVDDRDFLYSVWAEIDRALIEQGADKASLTVYEVLDENGAEYRFERYNAAVDFDIPE